MFYVSHSINRPEKMINIEREKYALPLPEKKPEEEDVYVYQVTFYKRLFYTSLLSAGII